jgi:hypothetical protein
MSVYTGYMAHRPPKTPDQPRSTHAVEITSFRLSQQEQDDLKRLLPNLVPGNSHHLISRKVVRDFLSGDLVYLTRQGKLRSRVVS